MKYLLNLSNDEKYKYLREVVYENVKHSHTGRLIINTFYCRKVAELLGGDYDSLNKIQKDIFKGDIVFEQINVEREVLTNTLTIKIMEDITTIVSIIASVAMLWFFLHYTDKN